MTDRTTVENTNASTGIGLTAYLTPLGAERASELFESNPGYAEYLTLLTEVPDELPMFTLRLEQGIYSMGWGSCHFHARADRKGDAIIGVENTGFYLGYAYVVRIESDNGDVWQNWSFTEDGSPRK
jgi:hypothetical protein